MNNTKDDILVKVEGLSKKFCKDLKTSLWYGLKDLMGSSSTSDINTLRPKEFWAVKDVSFELRRGECLGLIGHNGAGKSTLLKILNGLINPDAGKVTIKGFTGALIELGAGFNPILTGRENIYNNGAILGFAKAEIDSKLQDIIDFSEIEEFIDMPVQHYSSGMKVRLGFAIAAQMEPDVLIIDEVLAVGDLGFVLKCFKTIDTILPHTAVIFVSHNMPLVSRMCNYIILMNHGEVAYQGHSVARGIDLYYSGFANNDSNIVFNDNSLELESFEIVSSKFEEELPQLLWSESLQFNIAFKCKNLENELEFIIIIIDKEQRPIASFTKNLESDSISTFNERLFFSVIHEDLQLSKGIYSVNLAVRNRKNKEPIYRINDVKSFQVLHEEETWEPFLLKARYTKIEKNLSDD